MADVVNVDKEPELGDACPDCEHGTLVEKHGEGSCSCHISPPCSYCTDTTLICDKCSWEPEDPTLAETFKPGTIAG